MKTTMVVFQIFLVSSLFGQTWFNDNATWIYGCCSDYLDPSYIKIYNDGDTIVDNFSSKNLRREIYSRKSWGEIEINELEPILAFENNNIVFLHTESGFDTLYNFNSNPGSSWSLIAQESWMGEMKVTVIDTGQFEVNNIVLKWMDLEFRFDSIEWGGQVIFRDTVVERIGPLNRYFLPWNYLYIAGAIHNLRCYFDDEIGEFKNSSFYHDDCEYLPIINSVFETNENSFKVFPNPTSNKVFVKQELETFDTQLTIEIYNSLGELIFHNLFNKSQEIDLNNETSGIFLIIIREENKIFFWNKFLKI